MSELRRLHEAYHEYKHECNCQRVEAMDYSEWVEELAIQALCRLDDVSEALAHYQEASYLNLEAYENVRTRLEYAQDHMRSIQMSLYFEDYKKAEMLVSAQVLGN